MTTPSLNRHLLRTNVYAVTLWLLLLTSAEGTPYDLLLKNPKVYDGQTVSVVGVIRGNGPDFELYRDAKAASSVAPPSTSFFVFAPDKWKGTQPYDMRLVRVTGIVEARRHGVWGNACALALKRIEVLSNAPAAHPSFPVAVVRNETSEFYSIRAGPLGVEAQLGIGPKEFLVLPRYDGTLTVLRRDGAVVARQELKITRESENFDSVSMVFYYRITDRRIDAVKPAEARKWSWRR
jgi:hypothetical protein